MKHLTSTMSYMVVRHGLFLRKLSIWLTFEREILRKIFGSMQAKWVWRIRYNKEVYKFYDMAL
jgi:hypothetical protein